MDRINLSNGEWKLTDLLWQNPPKTIIQLTKKLEELTGQERNVIITMLKRLEAKGAIRHREGEQAKLFYPTMDGERTILEETRGFLNRIFQSSFSLTVNAVADSRELSGQNIEELKEILEKAEGERHD